MKQHLVDLHIYLMDQVAEEPNNIVVLYYYSLTCMLARKFSNCAEALKLLGQLYALNYDDGKFIMMDYFKAKANNIQVLLTRVLTQQANHFQF
jgi:hypothetical protein